MKEGHKEGGDVNGKKTTKVFLGKRGGNLQIRGEVLENKRRSPAGIMVLILDRF